MVKPTFFPKPPRTDYECFEGEQIEEKVRRIVNNNEPITDGAPIIFTEKKDGVLPEYNIRTDRWDIALDGIGYQDSLNWQRAWWDNIYMKGNNRFSAASAYISSEISFRKLS